MFLSWGPLHSPYLLYDSLADPHQMKHLGADPAYTGCVQRLDAQLRARLEKDGDDFAPGREIVEREGYVRMPRDEIAIMASELPAPY